MHRRVPLRRRGQRRVHHRPGVGRPRAHLRERQPPRRDRALRAERAAGVRRRRPRPAAPGPHAHDELRATPPSTTATASASMRRVPVTIGVPAETVPLRRDGAAVPLRPERPHERNERCAEVYHIQVQGLATRLAATGLDEAGHRRVGRARLDPGPHRRGEGDGPPGPAPDERARLHDAGVRHVTAHAGPTRTS